MHAHCHAYAYMKNTMRAFLLMFAIAKFSNALLPLTPTSTLSSRPAAYMTLMRSSAMRAAASPALMAADAQVSITSDTPMRQGRKSAKDYYIRCQDPACTGVCASYGYEADGKRIRCVAHKDDDMVSLTSTICENPSCQTVASFGEPNTTVSSTAVPVDINSINVLREAAFMIAIFQLNWRTSAHTRHFTEATLLCYA
jgi:EsV-1-7 cysteine-rich motif